MSKKIAGAALAILAIVAAQPVWAGGEQYFNVSFSNGTDSGNFTVGGVSVLDPTTNAYDGTYFINSISGSVDGLAVSLLQQTSTTQPPACMNACATQINGFTLFWSANYGYNDILYTGASQAVSGGSFLDIGGLGLATTSNGITSNLIGFPGGTYGFISDSSQPYQYAPVNLTVSAVPEPEETIWMMAAGLAGMLAIWRRRRS